MSNAADFVNECFKSGLDRPILVSLRRLFWFGHPPPGLMTSSLTGVHHWSME